MIESVILTVTGMKCGGCETNVTDKLNVLAGVLKVRASSKDKQVEIEFDAEKASRDAIIAAISEAGFTVQQ